MHQMHLTPMPRQTGRVRKFIVACVAAVGVLHLAGTAVAQSSSYPNKPVKVIVPYAPGGPTDLIGRLVADTLGHKLKASVIVENKAGAGGVIGTTAVVNSPADGYTLMYGVQGPITINPALTKVPYDVFRDLVPLRLVSVAPMLLMASKSSGIRSVAEMMAASKASPKGLSIGSSGVGTLPHMAAQMLAHDTGASLTHVPYKGAGPALADLAAGHIQLLFSDLQAGIGFVQAGQVTPLAITASTRTELLPNLPTLVEAGGAKTALVGWQGLFAPAKTPAPVLAKLNTAMDAVMRDPEFRKALDKQGGLPGTLNNAEFTKFLRNEYDNWANLGKLQVIKLD